MLRITCTITHDKFLRDICYVVNQKTSLKNKEKKMLMMNKRDRIEENNKINFKIEDQGLPVKI